MCDHGPQYRCENCPSERRKRLDEMWSPRYVSGMSEGEIVIHKILIVCTLGLWSVVYFPRKYLRRHRIQ